MSKYYSVQTNNRFGLLNLDSEDEQILSVKPDSVVKKEEAEAQRQEVSTKKGSGKGNKDVKREVRGGGNSPARADYHAETDNRARDKVRTDRRAEESTKKRFDKREGQRKLDKRSEHGVKKAPGPDTDPTHEVHDKELAAADVIAEAGTDSDEAKQPKKEEPVIQHTVQEYQNSMAADRYQVPQENIPSKHDDLEREINEAGLKMRQKEANAVHCTLSKTTVRSSGTKDTKGLDDLEQELGRKVKMHRDDDRFGGRDERRRHPQSYYQIDRSSKKKEKDMVAALKKKDYKHDSTLYQELFPTLE